VSDTVSRRIIAKSRNTKNLKSFMGEKGEKDLPDEYNNSISRSKGEMRDLVYGDGRPVVVGADARHETGTKNTRITIEGFRFNGTKEVGFGSNLAERCEVRSDTEITATAPNCTSTAELTVKNEIGTSEPYIYNPNNH
jgi:hypothetical protein